MAREHGDEGAGDAETERAGEEQRGRGKCDSRKYARSLGERVKGEGKLEGKGEAVCKGEVEINPGS